MKLLSQILTRIQTAAAAGDLDQITRLNGFARRVREIEEGQKAFEAELLQIAASLAGTDVATFAPNAEAVRVGPITVEIDFPRLGVNRPPTTICERQASDTMRKVVEVLVEVRGASILQTLAKLRINRGPFVSANPSVDYNNPQSGQAYAHQPIGGTGFFVLTHSSTPEKVRDLGILAQTLGFSPLHFRVRKHETKASASAA